MCRSMSVRVASKTLVYLLASVVAIAELAAQSGQPQTLPVPIPGRNINMVSGTTFPDGDPFMQRQNEPSIAVSTRNPLHLFGAANDYRTVDIPGLVGEVNGDAWIGIFKSFDGGGTWRSTLLPGFPHDGSAQGATSPLRGLEAGADPVVRAGTNGLFYLSGIAFNRASSADGKVFLARYIDNNNLEAGDPFQYLGTSIIDVGTDTRFLDKPWIAVDIPRGNSNGNNGSGNAQNGHGRDDDNDRSHGGNSGGGFGGASCQIPGQAKPIPAGPVYVMYSVFISPSTTTTGSGTGSGNNNDHDNEHDRDDRWRRRPRRDHDWDGDRGRDRDSDDHDHDEHRPGQPMEGRTQIMFSRSLDCGATFSRPTPISDRTQINQGSVAAIDPNTGDIYVAWREFMSSAQPDAILVTKSTDGGVSFSDPVTIARITPFDQSTSTTRFRTNSYPAMTVDGDGRVYVAWSQRNVGPFGDARIVISSSTTGRTWTAPVAADNHGGRGHQFMPVLSSAGGRLHLAFWDQRDDVSHEWGPEIDDATILASHAPGYSGPRKLRHTLDLYAAAALPGNPPQFGASRRLSDYPRGSRNGSSTVEQMAFNAPNLPLFSKGTQPFIGDYLDITASPSFIANGDGTWRYNTRASDPAIYFASWSDNRDVRAPADGNWSNYTAPTFGLAANTLRPSVFDPSQLVMCTPGQAGMRNQNIYSTRVANGLIATMLGNTKPLGLVNGQLIQRTFVATISNPDATRKAVVLHIPAQPAGGRASFLQFAAQPDLPVVIEAKSSISREVFVTSTDRMASVAITIEDSVTHTTAAQLLINPDFTNPDILNPDILNPDILNPDILNAEAHAVTVSNPDILNRGIRNPDILNPDILNPDILNPDILNPDILNPDILNPDILNPDILNPDILNPDILNPDILNPDILNPDILNPDILNTSLTDVTWKVSNVGNTATSYQVKMLLDQAAQARLISAGVQFQLIITKTTNVPVIVDQCTVAQPGQNITVASINNPSFVDPKNAAQFATVVNPDILNGAVENATVALGPGEKARVTLRIFSPSGDTGTKGSGLPGASDALFTGALEDLNKIGVVTTSHPVDTTDVNNNITTPQITASIPIIVTTTLPDGARTRPYSAALEQTGATAPFTFAVATGALPPGLSLSGAGVITGIPATAGVYTFGVRLTDANAMTADSTQTIRVFEPLTVAPLTLTQGAVNQAYTATVAASGGFAPYGWSIATGALPAGVSLSPAGVVSGTPTQSGPFTFTASASDTAAPSQLGSGPITLNVAPSADAQSVTVVEDTPRAITLTGTGAPAFTFAIGQQPLHGSVSVTGATATYTPASNYTGADSFTFRVAQGALTSGFATVSLTVTAVNDAPTANPQTVSTPVSTAKSITLTGTDPEGSALTYSIQSNPQHGSISGGNGAVRTYTPANGYQGADSFTFRVNDGALNSTNATVTVEVGPPLPAWADVMVTLTDAPDPVALGSNVVYTALVHNNGPAAATGATLTIPYSTADFNFLSATGASCAGTPLVCALGTIPNGGNVTVALTLKAANRGGVTVSTTATVSATPFDYNTANSSSTQTTAVTGSATPTADLAVSQAAPATVSFGAAASFAITVTNNGPSNATAVVLTNTFTAATATVVSATGSQGLCSNLPGLVTCSVGSLASGATATYTIAFTASGSGTITNTATVSGAQTDGTPANNTAARSVTVNNRNPTATDDVATILEDTPAAISVLGNDTDPDGDTLTITLAGNGLHGTTSIVGNAVRYAPAANYNGPDSFSYTIGDGHGGSASATVAINVIAVNDVPTFVMQTGNLTYSANAGPQSVAAWASGMSAGPADEAGQLLNFIVGNDNHLLFSVQPSIDTLTGTLTLTPSPSATPGVANITVWLQDNGGTLNGGIDTTAPRTFTIAVTAPNFAPTAVTDNATTNEDTPAIIAVLSNDTDPENDTLSVTGTTPPSHGGVVVNPDKTITYSPAQDYNGADSFTYTVDDGHGHTAIGTVNLTVTAVNDAPSFIKGADQTVLEDPGPQSVPGWATAISAGPADESAQTVNFIVSSNNAALFSAPPAVSATGTLTYTPAPNANGVATVQVQAHDNGGTTPGIDTSAVQTFTISVTAVQDPPTAADDSASGNDGAPIVISVLANDSDPDGDPLSIIAVGAAAHGSAIANPNGTITYTSVVPYSGGDSFSYTISDGQGGTASANVAVTVTHANHTPTAVNDTDIAVAGFGRVIPVLQNDFDIDNPTGQVVATVPFLNPSAPVNLAFPGNSRVVTTTNQLVVGNGRSIAVLDATTHAFVAAVPVPNVPSSQLSPSASAVDQATGYVYLRRGSMIDAFDNTTNTLAATLTVGGSIQNLAYDSTRHVLYVTYQVSGAAQQTGVLAIDEDPTHGAAFHRIAYSVTLPSGLVPLGLAVNTVTNRIYIGTSAGGNSGIYLLDGATHAVSLITGSVGAVSLATDSVDDLVWAVGLQPAQGGGQNVELIDPTNSNTVTLLTVPGLVISSTNLARRGLIVDASTRAYIRSNDGDPTHTGSIYVLDAHRASGTFKNLVGTITTGIDGSADDMELDASQHKLVATSGSSFKIIAINGGNTPPTAVSIPVNMPVQDVSLTAAGHALVLGSYAIFDVNISGAGVLSATTDIGAEAGVVTVDTVAHKAYVPRDITSPDVMRLNKTGPLATGVSGVQAAGRYPTAVVNSAAHRLYLLNSGSNVAGTTSGFPAYVSVIDTTTDSVVATVPVGNASFGLGYNPVNNTVYAGGLSSTGQPASITAINGATNAASTVNTGAFSSDTNAGFFRDFVTNTATNRTYFRVTNSQLGTSWGVINGATNIASPMPTSFGTVQIVKVNSTLNRVYVGNTNGQFYVLDGATHAQLASMTLGSGLPFNGTLNYIAVDEGNGHVYVADYNGDGQGHGLVTVLDGNNNHNVIATLLTGAGPGTVAINTINHRVYVANYDGKSMTFIDGTALVALTTLPTPLTATFLAVDAAESRIYTSNGFDPATGTMVIADAGGTPTLTVNGTTNGAQGTVTVNPDQTVTYTAAGGASGSDSFTYTITDGLATSAPATVSLTFYQPVRVTTASLAGGASGTPYTATLAATGGTAPYKWVLTSGSLPGGVLLTSDGRLVGTPNTSGTFSFSVEAADSGAFGDSAGKSFTIVVGPLAIITTGLSSAPLGSAYSFTLNAGGSALPLTWTVSSGTLPAGLSLSAGGVISGIPSQPDCTTSSPFTIQVTDGSQTATRTFNMNFSGQVRFTSPSSLTAVVLGTNFPSLAASCGSGVRTFSIASGALPLGVTFTTGTTSAFGGVSKQNGNFPVVAQVSDNSGTVTKNITLVSVATDQSVQTGPGAALAISPAQRVAQTITVGANGALTALRFQTLTCSVPQASNPLTVTIEGVLPTTGLPDDTAVYATIPNVTITGASQILTLPTPLTFAADVQLAIVASSTGTCSIANGTTSDTYQMGAAYTNTGGGWTTPASIFDVPVTTLIQNSALLSFSQGLAQVKSITLNNGKILVVGTNGVAQIVDPLAAGTAAPTSVTMVANRVEATATLIPSTGKVVVVGGVTGGTALASAEIFDPAGKAGAGSFTAAAGTMAQGRSAHTATLLATGKILIAGGQSGGSSLQTAYLFDPAAGTFSSAINMIVPRQFHRATVLGDNRVLITGGANNFGTAATAEIFDPSTGVFTASGAMATARFLHTATLLNDGTVLVTGGTIPSASNLQTNTAEIYTVGTASFTPAGTMQVARQRHAATLLGDGSVLITGGLRDNNLSNAPWTSAERYLPGSGFTGAPPMQVTRDDHGVERLSGALAGKLAILAGNAPSAQAGQSYEIYDPGTSPTGTPSISNPNLPDASQNVAYSTALAGTGGTPAYQFTVVAPPAMPAGLSLSTAGVISGTPTVAGTFHLTVRITDANSHSSDSPVTIRVSALSITTASLPNGYVGRSYSTALSATGVGSKTWTTVSGTLPAGLSLLSSGVISGSPTATGFTSFTVRATDSLGQTATAPLTMQVNNPLIINTTSPLPDGIATSTYFSCFQSNNGTGPMTWSMSGTAPLGLSLQANGCFDSSFPAHQLRQAGTFTFNVNVTDSSVPSQTDSKNFTLRVDAVDQTGFTTPANGSISLPSTRKVAEVFTSSTAFDLSGVQFSGLTSCLANTQITATVRPVTGSPAFPDETGANLGSVTVTANSSGVFPFMPLFPSPIAMPQHSRYAIVLSFTAGSCTGTNWSTNDSYQGGDGWVSDNGGPWTPTATALSRVDVPLTPVVLPPSQTALTFTNNYRNTQASVTLFDGRVLILGPDASAEIYDPAGLPSPTLTPTTGTMTTARGGNPTATLLPDHRVLIAGGSTGNASALTSLASTEIFDPSTGLFTAGGTMATGRSHHQATLLGNGKILITGGWNFDGSGGQTVLQSAELLSAGGVSQATLTMNGARTFHSATLLANGTVLIAGGWRGVAQNSAEIYDPAAGPNGAFTPTTGAMQVWRTSHTATLLTTGPWLGQVLLAGGYADYPTITASTELFNPANGLFSAGPVMNVARQGHTATALPNGDVVLAGGGVDWLNFQVSTSSIETFVASSSTIAQVGDLVVDRNGATAELIGIGANQGKVLVVGGNTTSAITGRTVEVVDATANALVITTAKFLDGQAGNAYLSSLMSASGGTGAGYAFAVVFGKLPPGAPALTMSSQGVVQGTPSTAGIFSFVVRVTDSGGHTASKPFTIVVNRLSDTSPQALSSGVSNAAYSGYQLLATGGPVTWTLDSGGSLPPGMSMSSSGFISGTPTAGGNYFFNVRLTDTTGQVAAKSHSINIASPLSITTSSLNAGLVQYVYNGCLAANGGVGGRSWSISGGALPPGVTLNSSSGCFNGTTIVRTGVYTFTARVQDSDAPPQVATRNLTVRVGGNDQSGPSVDSLANYWLIHSSQQMAQTFRQTMTGNLLAFQAPISCTAAPGDILTMSLRPVDGLGHIDMSGAPLTTENIDATTLPTFQSGPFLRTLTFSSPVFAPIGVRLAVIFSTTNTTSCVWNGPFPSNSGGFDYAYGDAFAGTGSPAVFWTPLRSISSTTPDLPFGTIVDPLDALDYMPTSSVAGSHSATTLANNTILLAGSSSSFGPTAVVYTPALRSFVPTLGAMSARRQNHTATTLPGGLVLIVGGMDPQTGLPLNSAETYNPSTGTFTPVSGTLTTARWYHTASLLGDGRVLIAGGETAWNSSILTSEIFDPGTGQFTVGPPMHAARAEHSATTLGSGDVLIVGGFGNGGGSSAERYVPSIGGPGSFVLTTGQPGFSRAAHSATKLPSGLVLLAGGWSGSVTTATTQLYDPSLDVFSSTAALTTPSAHHAAVLLNNGQVLIAGGDNEVADPISRLELYDVPTGSWSRAGFMAVPRATLTATLMNTGSVLLAGGFGDSNSTGTSADHFDPSIARVAITNPNALDGAIGVPYSYTLNASTASFAFTKTTGELPPGLSFANGVISGNPTLAGAYYFGVHLLDTSTGRSVDQTIRIRINPVDVITSSLPQGQVGVPYNQTLTATGSGLTWALVPNNGVLPPGLTLQTNGTINGTPTLSDVHSFVVEVTDVNGQQTTRRLSINVLGNQVPQAFNDGFNAIENVTFNQPAPGVLANDVDPDSSLSVSIVANASHGTVTLNANGSFSYVPALDYIGPDSFTYKANDGYQDSNVATVNLSISQRTINVPSEFATIQGAINAATRGAVVQVAAGTYHENLVWSGKDFTLTGSGAATTIVDGGHNASVLHASNLSAASSVSGFTFQNGEATTPIDWTVWGGGLLLENAPITLSNNRIVNNHAGGGGGLSLFSSDATIVNNTISNNVADFEGGGIDVQQSSPVLTRDVVSYNASGGDGGGIWSFSNTTAGPVVIDSLVNGNTGQHGSGAGITVWNSHLSLVNTTVTENSPGGVRDHDPWTDVVSITNSILWGNLAGPDLTGQTGAGQTTSLASINYSTVGTGSHLPGTAVLNLDPQFVSPGTDNYRLGTFSPAINAGTNAAVTYGTDLDGNPRVTDSTVDQGAYEYIGAPTTFLGPVGGSGGTDSYSFSCSPTAYATGFRVATGPGLNYALTGAILMCSDGNDKTIKPFPGGAIEVDEACNAGAGERMVGFLGDTGYGNGYVVEGVGARCKPVSGPIYSTATAPTTWSPFGPLDCPAGQVVVGAQGTTGAVIDNITLVCGVRP